MSYRSDSRAPDESGCARLEPELLHGAQRLWHRSDSVVQHRTGKRGPFGGGRYCAALSEWEPDLRKHACAADEFLADEPGVLAAGLSGDGKRDGASRGTAVSAIWRSAVVVLLPTNRSCRGELDTDREWRHAVLRCIHEERVSIALWAPDACVHRSEQRSDAIPARVGVPARVDWAIHGRDHGF